MLDRGTGVPVVLIPGIQGRWEWMHPAVDAFAAQTRVITDSLPGDPHSVWAINPDRGFDNFVDWIDLLIAQANVDAVSLCGVSYGGWIALHYAAARPTRVLSLTLASTPPPTWQPPCRVEWYLRAPRLMAPLFVLSSPLRLSAEITAAFPRLWQRSYFVAQHLSRIVRWPMAPTLMAQRVQFANTADFTVDCGRIVSPTQVLTGEAELDRVVAVRSSREYLEAIPGAQSFELEHTGHIGVVTRPDRFADVVTDFARAAETAARPNQVRVPA